MNKVIRIIGVAVIVILIIFEQVLDLNSFVKQGYKVILLVLIPISIIYFYKKNNI